jgi:hypothetical protein
VIHDQTYHQNSELALIALQARPHLPLEIGRRFLPLPLWDETQKPIGSIASTYATLSAASAQGIVQMACNDWQQRQL